MIRQDDNALPKAINNWGCYFMAILYHAGLRKNKEFGADEIEAIYKSAMATGIIGKEVYKDGVLIDGCYINDPTALFSLCGVGVTTVKKTEADYQCVTGELEISHFKRLANTPAGMNNSAHDHFVATSDGKVIYDGLGNSNTVRYGFLKSKRVFK